MKSDIFFFVFFRFIIDFDIINVNIAKESLIRLNRIKEGSNFDQRRISKLIEENYLNESRFAQSFARGKFRIKKWGKQRIIRELKGRKISDYNIKLGLKEISALDYQSTFYHLFEKRKEAVSNYSISIQKKKIIDFMMNISFKVNRL